LKWSELILNEFDLVPEDLDSRRKFISGFLNEVHDLEEDENRELESCTLIRGKLILVTAQRFSAASVADINKRRCLNKQTKTALVWPHTTWINPLSPVDRILFFFSLQIRYSRRWLQ